MILEATLNQMAYLFLFVMLGYILVKLKLMPNGSETVLSRLENYLFIPALVLNTFINNFTVNKLSSAYGILLFSIILEIIVILVSVLCTCIITKDKYIRKIYLYGLCFSNFGFMGNAVVSSLFPALFLEYIIFTMVLWSLIYLWGIPILLKDGSESGFKSGLKNLFNPMLICMLLGGIIGILKIQPPQFLTDAVNAAGQCMSPVAMIITGMTIAKMDIRAVLKIKSIYIVSVLRLLVFPITFIAVMFLFGKGIEKSIFICATVSLAMPLGLNTIVIPNAYGKDTSTASGMALVSHLLSVITIPVIFTLMQL